MRELEFPVPFHDIEGMTADSSSEKARLAALHSYHLLDSAPEASFDRLTRLASLVCHTPISLITLLDEDRQWFKSKVGLDVSQTAREVAFCDITIRTPHLLQVPDLLADARFQANPLKSL